MAQHSSPVLKAATDFASGSDSDFDLNIETFASAPVVAGLLNDTGDGCGGTCQSACSNSTCIGG